MSNTNNQGNLNGCGFILEGDINNEHKARIVLQTDASAVVVGDELQPLGNGAAQVLSLFILIMHSTQSRSNTFGRKFVTMYLPLQIFLNTFYGAEHLSFTLITQWVIQMFRFLPTSLQPDQIQTDMQ